MLSLYLILLNLLLWKWIYLAMIQLMWLVFTDHPQRGDFNLNWLANDSNSLKEMCDNLSLSQLIDEQTRPNFRDPSKSTLIDFILSNRRDKITASRVFALGPSDHCPAACIRSVRLERTFRQLRNKCTSSLRKAKAIYYTELICSSFTNPSKFWKAVNVNKNKSSISIPS